MKRVGIVGGGIGGLTLAVALRRRGIEAAVYEEAPELRAVGAGIWVPSNALQVLGRLDLAEPVVRAGRAVDQIDIATTARVLSSVPIASVRARTGHGIVSIHRGELQRILVQSVGAGITLGARAVEARQDEHAGAVRFADGTEIEADVVVGCDGIGSVVRAAIAPAARLRYGGQTCYRGVATLELPPEHRATCRETWGGRVRFGYSALDGDRVYWFAPVTAPPGGEREPSPRATLAPLLAPFPAPIPAILEATPDEAISRLDLHDLAPLSRWHDRRIALLGDAAHATTPNLGQGGAQAIEDAWVLARCLADEESLQAALAAYERTRRPRVRWIVATARRMGALAHWENPVARAVRDLAVRTTPAAVTDRMFTRLFTADA